LQHISFADNLSPTKFFFNMATRSFEFEVESKAEADVWLKVLRVIVEMNRNKMTCADVNPLEYGLYV
jgi:hypothetical protein